MSITQRGFHPSVLTMLIAVLLSILGVVLLCVLIVDVYVTVFVPRGRAGLIASRTYSFAWNMWRKIGGRWPEERRRNWLAQLGPLLVPVTVLVWGTLLIVSFALIYAPWVQDFGISPPESGPMADWAKALYYSGYSAVTLGVGDVIPNGTFPRLLAVAEAGFGFAIITVSVTYLLSVYSARNQATIVAVAISRFIGRRDGADPIDVLIATAQCGTEAEVSDWLGRLSADLVALVALEGQYPLVNYFHEPKDDHALPIALSDLLELVTLCRALLSPDRFPELAMGPTTQSVERIGRHFLRETSTIKTDGDNTLGEERRRRYEDARSRLEDGGVSLRNEDEAWSLYDAIRSGWDMPDERAREWFGYRSATESR